MTKPMCSRKIKNAYYYVYDIHTDELIICGIVKDVCARLDITKSTVSKAVKKGSVVRRRYKIYYEDDE